MHGDIAGATAVADDVAAAADLDRGAGAMASEAAGAGAAEQEHLRGAIGRPGAGLDGQDEVVADDRRDVGPGRRHRPAEAFAVTRGTDAGEADADTVGARRELVTDGGEQGGEFFGGKELQIARADGEGGQDVVGTIDQESRGAGAAAFDTEDSHGFSGPYRSSRRRSIPWSSRGS